VEVLTEHNVLVFLVQVLVLLTLARTMGELMARLGQPAVIGELVAGILLGPTVFGHISPELHSSIFPMDATQHGLLQIVSWFGILFLLLSTGLEINLSAAWKQRGESMKIASVGVAVPMILGFIVFYGMDHSVMFAAFMATAVAISAIPVIARVLHDLELLKTDLGLHTLSAFALNELMGWAAFTFVLSFAAGTSPSKALMVTAWVVGFSALCLTLGRKMCNMALSHLGSVQQPRPGLILSFLCCVGLICGVVTNSLGSHATLGFLLAGVMAGGSKYVSQRTRETVEQMMHAVFVPLFFAGIGLRFDFFKEFDLSLVAAVLIVGIGGKFVGAWAGAIWAKQPRSDALSMGLTHIAGGSMEIVVAVVGLQYKLIDGSGFTALLLTAVISSIAVGPLVAWSIRRRRGMRVMDLFLRSATAPHLNCRDRWEVIRELCIKASEQPDMPSADELYEAVCARENTMGTGMEKGMAIPHARLYNISAPVLIFGRCVRGVYWDCLDGLPVNLVFLLLTPIEETGTQVQILSGIATAFSDDHTRNRLLEAGTAEAAFEMLQRPLAAVLEGSAT